MLGSRFFVCATLAALAVSVSATATERDGAANQFAPAVTGMTQERAADAVRSLFGGRILSARAAEREGEQGFHVRVLTDGGRVKNVFVDRFGGVTER